MARRGQPGIIHYTFGLEGRGARALLNVRMALVTLTFLVIAVGLVVAASQRSPVTLKIARNAALLPRVAEGERILNFFTAYLVNRGEESRTVNLSVAPGPLAVHWRGPAGQLHLAGGEHRRIDFGLEVAAHELKRPQQIELALRDAAGIPLVTAELTLTGTLDKLATDRAQ
jgi:hypothetical protein